MFAVGKASATLREAALRLMRLSVPALFPARTELRIINLSLLPSSPPPPLSLLPTPYSLLPTPYSLIYESINYYPRLQFDEVSARNFSLGLATDFY